MSSILKVDTIQDQSGNNIINESGNVITIGASGDTITVPAGATVSGFTSAGIDDNATSVAITIDSSERIGIGNTSPSFNLDINSGTSDDVLRLQSTDNTVNFDIKDSTSNTRIAHSQGSFSINVDRDNQVASSNLAFKIDNTEEARLTSTGLGIGTSTPTQKLEVIGRILINEQSGNGTFIIDGSATSNSQIRFSQGGTAKGYLTYWDSSDTLGLTDGSASGLHFSPSNQRVGIGTSAPTVPLMVQSNETQPLLLKGANDKQMVVETTGGSTQITSYQLKNAAYSWQIENGRSANTFTIRSSGGGERVRIDESGNLLVGKTSSSTATAGIELRATDQVTITRSGNTGLIVNRLSSDGEVVKFQKDGTNFGSIGVVNSDNPFFQGTATNHGGLQCGTNAILPVKNTANSDNTINLGQADIRWKDIYLSGGAYIGGTSTPNKLDDYEEGTWTPAYRGASSAGSYSTNASGTYTKVGNLVSVTAHLKNITQNSAGSGSIQIAGLPFAKSSSQESDIGSIYLNLFSLGGSDKYAIVNVNPSASVVLITAIDSDGASASTLQLSARQSDSADMFFSITYTT